MQSRAGADKRIMTRYCDVGPGDVVQTPVLIEPLPEEPPGYQPEGVGVRYGAVAGCRLYFET